jgi:hypothetical protein
MTLDGKIRLSIGVPFRTDDHESAGCRLAKAGYQAGLLRVFLVQGGVIIEGSASPCGIPFRPEQVNLH